MGSSLADEFLRSWRDDSAREAIIRFVEAVTLGSGAVPVAERIAVFDNDGTLWAEKPMPVQLTFIVEQWRAAVERDARLGECEPYGSAVVGDCKWLAGALEKHAKGDDTDLRTVIAAIARATEGMNVTEYEASVTEFAGRAAHPTLHRPYADTVYEPMVELLRYLEANRFTCYVVSGGDRDFTRPLIARCYGIPPEHVIGSSLGMMYDPATAEVRYGASFAISDDGAEKPVRIWSRVGRRPLFAAGNSDGDAEMLDYVLGGGRPGFALVVHHDDADRDDAAYDRGAEAVFGAAYARGYTVVCVARDWATVFRSEMKEKCDDRTEV